MMPFSLPNRILFIAFALICAPLSASAGELGMSDIFATQIQKEATLGKGTPTIMLRANMNVKNVQLILTSDGLKRTFSARRMRRGQTKTFKIKHPEGQRSWSAELTVTTSEGTGSFQFGFDTLLVGPPTIKVEKRDVDLKDKCVDVHLSHRIARIEIDVRADGGLLIDQVDQRYESSEKTERACWDKSGEVLERIDIKAYDNYGYWAGIQVIPFEIDIPHEDVVFDSGKWDIRPSEEPKLTACLAVLREKLAKHGRFVQPQLYVAGCTDTVGSRGDNASLSMKRARSIARWFRRHGVPIPIQYAGFGEDVLAVPTPDDTPEERNRRAIYTLSNGVPTTGGGVNVNWKRLK